MMGTKRQTIWVGSAVLIVAVLVAVVSYIVGYRDQLSTHQKELLRIEDKVKASVFENLKQGVPPNRQQIFMTLRSIARSQNVTNIDSTSLSRIIENVTAQIFQDSSLASDEKKDLLGRAESLVSVGYANSDIGVLRRAKAWGILGLIVLVIGLSGVVAVVFYTGPNRMTRSSLGSFFGSLITYLYNRYENDLAMSLVEENLVASPRNAKLYINKARLLLRVGRSEEALNTIDQGMEITIPSAKPYLHLMRAICLSKLDRQKEALEELAKSKNGFWGQVRSVFERFDFMCSRIEVYANLGNIKEALSESNKLIARYPKSPQAFVVRADILRRADSTEDSILVAERSIELSRSQADPIKNQRTTGLMQMAAAYSLMERLEESYEILSHHMPYRTSSLQTLENVYGFEKLLADNIYGKKLKGILADHNNNSHDIDDKNFFL